MTATRLLTAVSILALMTGAFARDAAAPATRPVEERADRAFSDQLSRLDADYRANKAEVLRRYAAQLVVAKNEALRTGDRRDAQRIYEKIAEVNGKIAELAPPTPPATRPALPFSVAISDFNGAAGLTNAVKVTETDISVTAENDFGQPPKVLWEAKLTAEQQDRLAKFLRSFPLDRLADSYMNPMVFDGFQVFFTIKIGDGAFRKVTLANRRQLDLERLIDEVNGLLPPKYLLSKMAP